MADGMHPDFITAEPLTEQAFEPFGQVFSAPREGGRIADVVRLQNLRGDAAVPGLSTSLVKPSSTPFRVDLTERHVYSSQTFIPLVASRYLLIVAPRSGRSRPRASEFRSFIAQAHQSIHYNPGTWHHPMVAIDAPASFAVLMWRAGTEEDEEFVDLQTPFQVRLPARAAAE